MGTGTGKTERGEKTPDVAPGGKAKASGAGTAGGFSTHLTAIKHELRQVELERLIDLFKHQPRFFELGVQVLCHARPLSALAREDEYVKHAAIQRGSRRGMPSPCNLCKEAPGHETMHD